MPSYIILNKSNMLTVKILDVFGLISVNIVVICSRTAKLAVFFA
jgi:hypothetical protein